MLPNAGLVGLSLQIPKTAQIRKPIQLLHHQQLTNICTRYPPLISVFISNSIGLRVVSSPSPNNITFSISLQVGCFPRHKDEDAFTLVKATHKETRDLNRFLSVIPALQQFVHKLSVKVPGGYTANNNNSHVPPVTDNDISRVSTILRDLIPFCLHDQTSK